jgi:hypothetical protein
MTGMVTVRLILYGLIAFVPNSKDSPATVNALLVDARGPQYTSDGCRIPPHKPVIYAAAGQCSADGRPCTMSDKIERPQDTLSGGWLLDRESLSIEVTSKGKKRTRKLVTAQQNALSEAGALPATPAEATSLRWIPRMETLLPAQAGQQRAEVDKDCLGAARDCPVVARVALDDGLFGSCHLSATEQEMVVPFEFKSLGSSAPPAAVQALSDAVMASFQVPRGSQIRIVSRDLSSQKIKRTIVLEDRGRDTVDVWIANIPSYHHRTLEHASCHDPDIDRHFELYYNLLPQPVPFSQRLTPSRAAVQGLRSIQIQPAGGEKCPLLAFADDKASAHQLHVMTSADEPGRVPNDWKSCGNIQLNPPPQ